MIHLNLAEMLDLRLFIFGMFVLAKAYERVPALPTLYRPSIIDDAASQPVPTAVFPKTMEYGALAKQSELLGRYLKRRDLSVELGSTLCGWYFSDPTLPAICQPTATCVSSGTRAGCCASTSVAACLDALPTACVDYTNIKPGVTTGTLFCDGDYPYCETDIWAYDNGYTRVLCDTLSSQLSTVYNFHNQVFDSFITNCGYISGNAASPRNCPPDATCSASISGVGCCALGGLPCLYSTACIPYTSSALVMQSWSENSELYLTESATFCDSINPFCFTDTYSLAAGTFFSAGCLGISTSNDVIYQQITGSLSEPLVPTTTPTSSATSTSSSTSMLPSATSNPSSSKSSTPIGAIVGGVVGGVVVLAALVAFLAFLRHKRKQRSNNNQQTKVIPTLDQSSTVQYPDKWNQGQSLKSPSTMHTFQYEQQQPPQYPTGPIQINERLTSWHSGSNQDNQTVTNPSYQDRYYGSPELETNTPRVLSPKPFVHEPLELPDSPKED